MKKTVLILIFLSAMAAASAQVWLEGFALYSSPMQNFLASGDVTIKFDGFEPFTYPKKDAFRVYADPQFGGGINLRYASNRLTVGMEISYVEYKPATAIGRFTMFRIGPMVEYYFLPESKFHPYLGGEVSLNNVKAFFNGDVINESQFSDTYFGVGGRAGFVYMISEKLAFRFGAKYALLERPYIDLSAGIAFNIGDF